MGDERDSTMRDLFSIRERVNRLFEDVHEEETGEVVSFKTWAPPVDVYETDTVYVVKAELPEVAHEDVEIGIDDDVLVIKGQRRFRKDRARDSFYQVERKYGMFRRAFRLPSSIDKDGIRATLRDGILSIELPKRKPTEAVQVQIT